ncbi:MAG: LysR family transcriptional regulator [Cyanobacteria bacterium J06627_32]
MTLAQLQTFSVVADVGSFTIASEQLGMTQSAVSHAVAALEKELQVSLLERKRGSVVTTEIGKQVLSQAREMLAIAERIQQSAATAIGLETGRIRLGSFPSVSARLLPGLLRRFHQRYPGIEIALLEGTDQEVIEWIRSRTVDAGVVTLPTDKAFKTVELAQDEFLAVVPKHHRLANNSQVDIRQLSDEPFIMSKAGCGPFIKSLFRKVNVTPKIQFEVIGLQTIFTMVEDNMGITIVPSMTLPADCSNLHTMSFSPKQLRQTAFASLAEGSMTPALSAFLSEVEPFDLPGSS